jgi:hypothetical protein
MEAALNKLPINNVQQKLTEINEIFNSNDEVRIQNYIDSYNDENVTENNVYMLLFILLITNKHEAVKKYFSDFLLNVPIFPDTIEDYFHDIHDLNFYDRNFRNYVIYYSDPDNVSREIDIFKLLLKIIDPALTNANNIQEYVSDQIYIKYIEQNIVQILKLLINFRSYHIENVYNILLELPTIKISLNRDIMDYLESINYHKIILFILNNVIIEELGESMITRIMKLLEKTYINRSEDDLLYTHEFYVNIFKSFLHFNYTMYDILSYISDTDYKIFVRSIILNEIDPELQITPDDFSPPQSPPQSPQVNQPPIRIQPQPMIQSIRDLTVKQIKYKSLKRNLDNINNDISENLMDEEFINRLMNERYEIMISYFNSPIKSKNDEFIRKCKTNTDLITGTNMDLKDDDIYPIGFMMEDDEKKDDDKKLHCFDKASLLRSFTEPMFIYRTNIAVYRLIYPMYWITQEALIKIILSDKPAFKLIKEGDHDLGTVLGVGNWHGGHIESVYNVEELNLEL